ncbi:hypothetical protein ACF1AX_31245 [Streptomyces sp. NPDC014802]|uniref:hypothetical protein n=1 Tax=Streptomyces sp. NPDC014802 TaxID=3364917 RepID=UPI0036FC9006
MSTPPQPDTVCSIRSTTDPKDGTAACLMEWGPIEALVKPSAVLTTARDLAAAAAFAETDVALLSVLRDELQLDDSTLGFMMRDIRARRPIPPAPSVLRVHAVAGANTGLPYVHISRGSMKGELSPDEAREMAVQWTEAAVAAQIDVRLRYVLGEWGHLTAGDIDRLFTLLQGVQR